MVRVRETRALAARGLGLHAFRWFSTEEIPPAFDLRRRGWNLLPSAASTDGHIALAPCGGMDTMAWIRFLILHQLDRRREIILIGVEDSDERARLLNLGFGEVLCGEPQLGEIEIRALHLSQRKGALPRYREIGKLRLDLLARDGFAAGRGLGFHPREFELIWRLADQPGVPVSKQTLVRDVWRMGHIPETNSLAVHVSRLRDKLKIAGLERIVGTVPSGGYMLLPPIGGTDDAITLPSQNSLSDSTMSIMDRPLPTRSSFEENRPDT